MARGGRASAALQLALDSKQGSTLKVHSSAPAKLTFEARFIERVRGPESEAETRTPVDTDWPPVELISDPTHRDRPTALLAVFLAASWLGWQRVRVSVSPRTGRVNALVLLGDERQELHCSHLSAICRLETHKLTGTVRRPGHARRERDGARLAQAFLAAIAPSSSRSKSCSRLCRISSSIWCERWRLTNATRPAAMLASKTSKWAAMSSFRFSAVPE